MQPRESLSRGSFTRGFDFYVKASFTPYFFTLPIRHTQCSNDLQPERYFPACRKFSALTSTTNVFEINKKLKITTRH